MSEKRNTSGLVPLGRAVLVRDYTPERRQSTIIIPEHVQANMMAVDQRAEVIEIGPACWPDEPARARVGDKVLISKFAGHLATGPNDGKLYRLVNDRDVFARLEVE